MNREWPLMLQWETSDDPEGGKRWTCALNDLFAHVHQGPAVFVWNTARETNELASGVAPTLISAQRIAEDALFRLRLIDEIGKLPAARQPAAMKELEAGLRAGHAAMHLTVDEFGGVTLDRDAIEASVMKMSPLP